MPPSRASQITGVPRSVSKALKLLGLFTETRPRVGLSEIAALAGLPKGTAHRLLLSLEEAGFTLQDPETRKWGLGFGVLQPYYTFREQVSLYQVATPRMERLRDEVQETVCLVVEDSGDGICIMRVDPDHELRLHTTVGSREPLYAGASRKLLMAYLPEARREQIIAQSGLRPVTPRTVTDPQRLRWDLAEIRRQGYSVTAGEHDSGVAAVAAPLREAGGRVVASLSIAGPESRLTPERISRVLPSLLDTARQISRQLGYRGNSPVTNDGGSN